MDDLTSENSELVELVERARAGDKECLETLAEQASKRLYEFVYRLTMQEDLARDVVQETIVEMLQVFNKLRHVERFWYWLYGIAYNKLRRQYSKRKRHRAASLSEIPCELQGKPGDETVANVVSDELRQIVMQAMQTLDPRHRAILTMRCYDQLSYADIAGLMDCTEFGARALFYRAKKSLAKKLSAFGLGKGALLTGLVLFGKMTAVNEASAASVAVTAGSLKVGSLAATAAVLSSKAAIITVTTGLLATGTLVSPLNPFRPEKPVGPALAPVVTTGQPAHDGQHWYFFPEGPRGAVMLRTEALEKQVETRWGVLQNAIGNFQWVGDRILQNNHHWYHPDFSVMRLPTDDSQMSVFLAEMDGGRGFSHPTRESGRDLLVISSGDTGPGTRTLSTTYSPNALLEDYFHAYPPEGVDMVDNRDTMRQRGWTYFTLDGYCRGKRIQGRGRIPFVYATVREHSPWLHITIDKSTEIVDTSQGASLSVDGYVTSYASGAFFTGLIRPWQGLHVLDTLRRDAAQARIPFQTQALPDGKQAQVSFEQDSVKLVYTVDLLQDTLTSIDIHQEGQPLGKIRFNYFQDLSQGQQPNKPSVARVRGAGQDAQTMQWLFEVLGTIQ
jgi:RNA polymerase sigma-70 factor (ECF subfamily)